MDDSAAGPNHEPDSPPQDADGSVFARQGECWSQATELGRNMFRVRLGGAFRSAWMATLCTGLADRRVSIEQAHARRGPDQLWMTELTIVALPGAPDPKNIPYIELVNAEVTHVPSALQLDVCEAVSTRDHGASLLLTLEAQDTLGLLGSLLASLATLMLFPIEMHIETRGGRAYDSLWLAGMGGQAPSARAVEALQRLLATWKRG